jgi:GAF domain-containing protein/HAMP domain-containing protein
MRPFEFVRNLSLSIRLNVLAFVIFSLLLLGMVLATNSSMNTFALQAGRQSVANNALTIQTRFDELEEETINYTITLSKTPGLAEALIAEDIVNIQSELLIEAARLNFDDLDLTNVSGQRLFDKDSGNTEDEDKLIKLALLGFDASGPVVSNEEGSSEIFIAAASPIHDDSGKTIGTIIGSRKIDDKMLSLVNVFSGHQNELVLILNGKIVASDFGEEELAFFSPYLLDAKSIEQALAGQTVIKNQLVKNSENSPHALGYQPLIIGADTKATIGIAVNVGELDAIKGQLINNQRVVFAVFAVIGNILLAFYAVNGITNPLRRLQSAAEQLANGNYTQRMVSSARDEIGQLTNSFNSMAAQIRGMVTSLEQRVEQRTLELTQRSTELEKTTNESKKRASDLQTISEIARYLSTEKELERLLPLIAQIVSERFGFYHVGIFLLNETGKYAVLRAANSPGGKRMLERQHKLEVGHVGIVGYVTSTGESRLALDTGADAVYFDNPDLPDTHSEIALPLSVRGKIIGALDVQSTTSNAFTDADISIFGLLADQLAIAIDNARLLEDAQNALAESRTAFRQYLSESWKNKSDSEILGYHQTITGGQVVTINTADKIQNLTDDGKNTLTIPIQLHTQVIGAIRVRPNEINSKWSKDEINILHSVAERLGLALDNARLFEETSTRAERERLVTDITTKIRTTNDPQEMIQTAVNELKRALGVTHVEIVPQKMSPPDN